jgi:anti-anti-sigma factor
MAEAFDVVPLEAPRAFRLVGELDLATAPRLHEILRRECALPGDLTLDLSELTFMDSSGLHSILDACRQLASNGTLVLKNPSGAVDRVFEVADIEHVPGVRVARRRV